LKGLSLQLETSQEGRQQQSLVTLLGPAQCTLQDCQVTLAGVAAGADAPHLAVITLADPSSAMKMEPRPPRTMPDVDILNCIVRGEGDLLAVRASRPFDLNVSNALLALRGGSLLNVEASAENLSGQDAWQTVNLSQVTAYLGEHLLFLRAARNARGLLKTVVTAHECLFAAANGKALIHLDGMENEDQVRGLLAWHGKREQPNVYSGFPMLLDQSPRAEDTMLRPFDRDRWRAFTGESEDARFKRVQFTTAPAADEPWTRILPAHFRLKPNADLPKCGADLDELAKRFEIPEEE
jgi:hypothetical protein